MDYDFYKREHHLGWSIVQVKTLLSQAVKIESSTLISYAALEARITIERIEYELLVMVAHKSPDSGWIDSIESYKGIQKVNAKFNALKYRYQTFTSAFANALSEELPLKPFQFRKSEEFQSRLSQYIHLYYTNPADLHYKSDFMQSGITLLEEFLVFIENMFPIVDGGYAYGILEFSSLNNGVEIEFQNWLCSTDEDTDALTLRLKSIMQNYKPQ